MCLGFKGRPPSWRVGARSARGLRSRGSEGVSCPQGPSLNRSLNDRRQCLVATRLFDRENASRPVSRVLYGPGALRRRNVAAIHLGRALLRASCNLPGRRAGNCPEGFPSCRPYSVLLPVWFTVPSPLPGTRWALTPPFHPYPADEGRAVCFLWHCHWGRPRRTLSGTVFPGSPDFPRMQPFGFACAAARPAGAAH
jgi:hypothetical protein